MHPLYISHLSKDFALRHGVLRAVDDLNLSVPAGECWGLLGPNGAGKSTTIQCLSGALPPTHGEIFLNQVSVQQDPRGARRKLGLVPQDNALESEFTVEEQLLAYGRYFGMDQVKIRHRSRQLLTQFELQDKAKSMPYQLSGGMKRRLMIARALLPEPTVLVLDEPTAGLDPQARQGIWEAIQQAREAGLAILLTTHYMAEAERLCDQIALLHKGRLMDLGAPQELVRRHIALDMVEEEVRPGILWRRPPNLEDVFLKMTGMGLGQAVASHEAHRGDR
jgi:lipooligosaccharide transport system ATP-binding protein